jgi:hypothetical protein
MQYPLVIQIEEPEWLELESLAKKAGISVESYVTGLISKHTDKEQTDQ